MNGSERGPESDRWSPSWVMRRSKRQAVIGPRIVIAIMLPVAMAFYSFTLAALLAIPCGYIAWKQLRSLWPDLW
jgi:hypothetical protein